MKIGLIPAIRFEQASQRAIPVIGLYYLAAFAEKYEPGVQVGIYKTPEEVIAAGPDLVGISSVTENMKIALEWAEQIKSKIDAPIILGGDHISALPHTLPPVFDLGVVGEGEETFLEILRLMKSGEKWRERLGYVDGICFHKEGRLEITRPRGLIEPMDKIPYPRREQDVWGGFHYMFSSRGCPYHCTFCSPAVVWKRYRPFSAEYVLGEMREIFRKFEPYYIHFFDDLFIGDRARVHKLRKLIRREGYHRRVNFGGHIRADLMDDELCEDLMAMNFNSGSFGAESGSDKILKFLKCGTTTVEMNQQAIDICHRWGIMLNISFIIGTPGETEEDIKKTIEFIEKNRKKLIGIEIFVVLPYPGTPLWRMALRNGLVSDDMDWDIFRTHAYFSQFDPDSDFFYMNEAMDKKTFSRYIRVFQDIDREINKSNLDLYETIEKGVPSSKKYMDYVKKIAQKQENGTHPGKTN